MSHVFALQSAVKLVHNGRPFVQKYSKENCCHILTIVRPKWSNLKFWRLKSLRLKNFLHKWSSHVLWILRLTRISVIRLGYFWKVLETDSLTKLAQILSNFLCFLNLPFLLEDWFGNNLGNFGQYLAIINSRVWSHWLKCTKWIKVFSRHTSFMGNILNCLTWQVLVVMLWLVIVGFSNYSCLQRSLWNENQLINHVNMLYQSESVYFHCLEWNKVSCNQRALVTVLTTKQWYSGIGPSSPKIMKWDLLFYI